METQMLTPTPGRDYPRTWNEFLDWFATEEACQAFLEKLRWPQGFVCPRCGNAGDVYRASRTRLMCRSCQYQGTVTSGEDRFLSFTLSDVVLDDVAEGPDDAFEVALIDANTGASVLGGMGLSRGDAFFNLQADGTTRKANGVTVVRQPDGSRRVLVDLSGLQVGTVVNLSFDLIGFGTGLAASRSHVTISQLQLSHGLNAQDDRFVLQEDTPLTLDLVGNDLGGSLAGVQPVLVDGPAHGRLEVLADGRWRYIPEANFNGEDHFSYQLSDGSQTSNLAQVSLQVTPVNDAPLLGDLAASLEEDGTVVLDLLSLANDPDGDVLTLQVGDASHGTLVALGQGRYSYRPSANFHGLDEFGLTASDGTLQVSSRVRLTITAVNDAPLARDDAAQLQEDGRLTLALMANDEDVDGDALSLRIVSGPAHGTAVLEADGRVTYIPDAQWNGEDSFSYVLSDGQLDSAPATVRLHVEAQADAPTLVITDRPGERRELFRTGWESVRNQNLTSTLMQQRSLEGWSLVLGNGSRSGGSNGFEIWSSGDKLMDSQNTLRTVNAKAGNGNNWIELNDAASVMYQTLGIERGIDTVAGARYRFSLDVAGRLGFSADYTRFGVYLDGVRIGGDESTSGSQALDWQTRSFEFTGAGGVQTLRIVSEATAVDANGRGVMLDNLSLTETLAPNSARAGSPIPLSALSAALVDGDGSEVLELWLGELPAGSVLTDGVRRFTASAEQRQVSLTGWNLATLSLLPPAELSGHVQLSVLARAQERSNQSQAETRSTLDLTIQAANQGPVANSLSYQLQPGGSVVIDFASLVSDPEGNPLNLNITPPANGSLVRNPDGSYTYTPKAGFAGLDALSYTVSDGVLSASGRVSLMVQAGASPSAQIPPRLGSGASVIVQSYVDSPALYAGTPMVVDLSKPVALGSMPVGEGGILPTSLLLPVGSTSLGAQTGLVIPK